MSNYPNAIIAAMDEMDGAEASDFIDLAMAALDQAGLPVGDQEKVRAIIESAVVLGLAS